MKVLLIGGSGVISSGVAREAVLRGMDLWTLNRGRTTQFLPAEANNLIADYEDEEVVLRVLADQTFDTVVDFRAWNASHIDRAVRLFSGRTGQYIFISSGTVYKKPLESFVIRETAPLGNLHSQYARNKLACEQRLGKYIAQGFPGVIVRPSLTYCDFNPLMAINSRVYPYSIIHRMRKGKPVIVHGDGNSLWTITHTFDFARGITGLFGNAETIGEAFHITSDEVLDWNRIYTHLAHAAGVEANLLHISSETLGCFDPGLRESLLGDHACSAVFDNSKIKRFVPGFKCEIPFEEGAKRIVSWFDEDPATREIVDEAWDQQMDEIVLKYQSFQNDIKGK